MSENLTRQLREYMTPSNFYILRRVSLTPKGKVSAKEGICRHKRHFSEIVGHFAPNPGNFQEFGNNLK